MNDNEYKDSLKMGTMITILGVLCLPFFMAKKMLNDLLNGIEPKDYFRTEEGISAMFILFSYSIGFLFLFFLLKHVKPLLLKFLISLVLSMFLIAIELIIVSVINSEFLKGALIFLVLSLKLYYIFFRKVKIIKLTKIFSLFKKIDPYKVETFLLKAKNDTVKIENPFAGVYIQGGAGTGKSESILKPMIKQGIEQNFAYILYDFKGDLSVFEKQVLESNNIYDSYTLNFKEPLQSHRFNPVNPDFLKTPAEVFELSKTLFYNLSPGAIKQSNNYFLDEAINFFTAVVIYFKNKHKEYCTIPHIISALSQIPLDKIIPLISTDMEALPYIASLKNVLELGANKQLAGVSGTLQGNLAKFSSKEIFWVLSGNDFTPDINNPDDIKRLTIINNSVLPDFYSPLIAMIINVCLKNMNTQGRHKSAVYLDEFPTLYIPSVETIPATARSNKIATIFACQDYMQMVDKYGREKAQTIISNLSSQFFGRTTNVESIKLISELFGKYDKRYETSSRGGSSEIFDLDDLKRTHNVSESFQERYRVSSDELTSLKPGEFYTLIGSLKGKKSYKRLPELKKIKEEETSTTLRTLTYQTTEFDLESNYMSIHKTIQRIFK